MRCIKDKYIIQRSLINIFLESLWEFRKFEEGRIENKCSQMIKCVSIYLKIK